MIRRTFRAGQAVAASYCPGPYEPSPESAQDPGAKNWNRRLTLQLLRREAEELFGKKDP
jgi:hypothetical protein